MFAHASRFLRPASATSRSIMEPSQVIGGRMSTPRSARIGVSELKIARCARVECHYCRRKENVACVRKPRERQCDLNKSVKAAVPDDGNPLRTWEHEAKRTTLNQNAKTHAYYKNYQNTNPSKIPPGLRRSATICARSAQNCPLIQSWVFSRGRFFGNFCSTYKFVRSD